ncbi:GGDEF domain-containing protein [Acholeplasma granularum]|uniref:GGDEF domain-containing protein n=1 Tax=Acholeplasma granularum TaxID=264635 RepID=UPI00138AD381|nr:GGDEF domain-containing protein [Acholeplasma granularum]
MQSINLALFFYSFFILSAILISNHKFGNKRINDKMFNVIVLVIFFVLIGDILSRFEGIENPIYPILTRIGNFVTYGLSPIIGFVWFRYIHYKIYSNLDRLKKFTNKFKVIYTMYFIILIITQFTGWFYYIDSQNYYHRGPINLLAYLPAFLLVSLVTSLLISRHNRIENNHLIAYISFGIIPVIAVFLQLIYYSYALIPNALTFSALVLFLFVQNNRANIDYLTGLFNRRQLDYYLEDKINDAKKGKTFSAILIDLDNLKTINDTLGHSIGDEVIKATAKLLMDHSKKSDFVARYGGDEFLIITEITNEKEILNYIYKLNENFNEFNESQKELKIEFTYGYKIYEKESNLQAIDFFNMIDNMMYRNKNLKK